MPGTGVRFDDLPSSSLVLLSQSLDHCDLDTLMRMERRFHPPVVSPSQCAVTVAARSGLGDRLWAARERRTAAYHPDPAHHVSRAVRSIGTARSGRIPQRGGVLAFSSGRFGTAAFPRDRRRGPDRPRAAPHRAYEPRWFIKYTT